MPTVLAVDGNSLAHRAFHATIHEQPTGAFVAAGIVRMLASAWSHGPFDAVVLSFDDPAYNQRRDLFDGYKAHRPETDERLVEQLETLPQIMADCGFTVAQQSGVEADDLVAATVDACELRRWPCYVLSSDRDLLALVSTTTTMLRPRASFSDLQAYEPATVESEFGVPPALYTELAALRGDPSDGLDGARGVGPKMAARLVRDYGSVAEMYRNLALLPPKVETALRTCRDAVERNLLLMAPLPNLSVDVEGAVRAGVDVDAVAAALTDHTDAANRLRWAVERPPLPPRTPPLEPDGQEPSSTAGTSLLDLTVEETNQVALF